MDEVKTVKPEPYKGADAVTLRCDCDYVVKGGTGSQAPPNVKYEKGRRYPFSPRSAAHMARKVYAVHEMRDGKRVYLGDAPMFVDEAAEKAQRAAEQKAEKEVEKEAEKAGDGK